MAEEKLDTFDRFNCRTSISSSQDQLRNDVSCKVEVVVLINLIMPIVKTEKYFQKVLCKYENNIF